MPDHSTASGEPTAADVRRLHPDWEPYFGTADNRPRARRDIPGKAISVVGDTWQDVLDEITAADADLPIERHGDGLR